MAFSYVGTETQGSVDGKEKTYYVDAAHATNLGPGDVVKITGTANAQGHSEVDTGVTTVANTGVVSCIGYESFIIGESLSNTHLASSKSGDLMVNVDANALYECPVSNGPLVLANVGLNAPAVVTAGTVSDNVFTSNMGINATGVATTATLPFRIVKLLKDENGVLGNRARVRVNASTSKPGAAGV